MNVLLFLVPISLLLFGLAIAVFLWAVRDGQFEDLDSAPFDILDDSSRPMPPPRPQDGD